MSNNEHTLKEALEAMLRHYKLKDGYNEARIRQLWQQQMGPLIAQHTSEFSLRDRKLYIAVRSAPLRQELSMARETLRHRLNEALGEAYLQEVIIR
jgi:predicted nucleic acid-binding Zn ribbon protein